MESPRLHFTLFSASCYFTRGTQPRERERERETVLLLRFPVPSPPPFPVLYEHRRRRRGAVGWMFLREHRQRRRRKRGDAVGSWRTFSKQLPLDLVWNLDWNALSLKHNRGSVMQGLEFEVFFKAQLHKFGRVDGEGVDGEDQLAEAEWPAKQGKARQAKPGRIDIYRWGHDGPSFQMPSDTQWHVRTSVSDTP